MKTDNRDRLLNRNQGQKIYGLTLIELIVTVSIIALTFLLVGSRLGISNFWKEEAFFRKFRETISLLHQQAIIDQTYYRLDLNFEDQSFKVSAISNSEESAETLSQEEQQKQAAAQGQVGYLTQELSFILSPSIGNSYQLIPPPSLPSLAEEVKLPGDLSFTSIKTSRGEFTEREQDEAYILFSPRGYSEFAVIHINQGDQGKATILVNPFIGSTELYRDDRDFDWTYGRTEKDSKR